MKKSTKITLGRKIVAENTNNKYTIHDFRGLLYACKQVYTSFW